MKRVFFLLFFSTLLLSACAGVIPIPTPDPPSETEQEIVVSAPEPAEPTPVAADKLPVDPDVRIGTLDNGLTYYIRENDEPMNRAELWLAVNAGSVLEDEDQLGLAHFLEHMLFNGTENFEGSEIVDFFETIGMEFGPDINAYTSFDETVYTIQIPTDDAETISTAFDVLQDWAANATISPEEVDKERGVIVEEWRLRNETADGRIRDLTIPFIFGDSQYAQRLPIGDMDIVRNAPAETLRRYYEDWYRPDLMAFIAVGDFDADAIEALIQENFAGLSAPADPVPRVTFDVPDHEESQFLVVTDAEETLTLIQVIRKRDASQVVTEDDLQDDLSTDLFYSMLNERLAEIARQADAPFLAAGVGAGDLIRPVEADFISAIVEDEGVLPGLDALLVEVERVRRHGFTHSELDRAKENLLRLYETIYDERENVDNSGFANQYLAHYLEGQPIPGIADLYALAQALIPQITLDEVNTKSTALTATDNRNVLVIAPEKEEVELPDEQTLAAAFDAAQAQEIEPYEDAEVADALFANIPEPAAIIAENMLDEVGAIEIELENGVRVLLKSTDFKDDEVLFTASSPGGSSLVSDADFPEAATIASIIAQSGVGEFDQTELEKLLTGKAVSVRPYISEVSEGLQGGASPEDLEALFQLIHLYVSQPRTDDDAFEVFKNQQRAILTNRDRDPNAALQDALLEALYGPTIRRGTLPLEEIESLEYERALQIYADRFADTGDFSFVFVGSFDEDEVKSLARTYLGTLPAAGREETWQSVAPEPVEDAVETEVFKGEGDRSTVQLYFPVSFEPTPESRLQLRSLEGVLDIMLREVLREELGGIYSARIISTIRELPDPYSFVIVTYTADPDRVDELVAETFAQIDDLRSNGPSDENVEKVKAQILSNREEELEQNGFWLSLLEDYSFYDDEERLDVSSFEDRLDAITAEDIQNTAVQFLRDDRFVQAVLNPAALEPE